MFNHMKLRLRLALSYGFLVCISAILAISGLLSLGSVTNDFRSVTGDVVPKTTIANENIRAAYDYARSFAFIVTLEGGDNVDKAALTRAHDVLTDTVKLVNENVTKMESILSGDREKALLEKVKERRGAYGKSRNAVLAYKKAGENEKAIALMFTETNDLQSVYIESWKDFIAYENSLLNDGVIAAESTYRFAKNLLISIFMLGVVISVFVATRFTKKLLHSLGGEPEYARTIAEKIATGDLSMEVEIDKDDQSSLLYSIKSMRDHLTDIVGNVLNGTQAIARATDDIASGNMDLSSRTGSAAGSLEETAASMEELTSTVKQNADNAKQANQLAKAASEVAIRGGTEVSQVVETMGSINESSKKIVDIIGVIDGIAFQTNILALNAAVEAARAGEQGRGFAVVAAEVRNLAQRSAGAAKEIKELINDSVQKVEAGSKLVDQAGTTMNEVVVSIKHVTDIMGEITAASLEQTTGIEQINHTVIEMDNVTQQNAALVEEAAAAAAQLNDQTTKLTRLVSVFKLQHRDNGNSNTNDVRRSPSRGRVLAKITNPRAL